MPLYEYHCTRCGNDRELLRKAEERDDPVICERFAPQGQTGPELHTCNQAMERRGTRIAYPGRFDTRSHKLRGLSTIHHNRGGPR